MSDPHCPACGRRLLRLWGKLACANVECPGKRAARNDKATTR
jgi:hypothetical protein